MFTHCTTFCLVSVLRVSSVSQSTVRDLSFPVGVTAMNGTSTESEGHFRLPSRTLSHILNLTGMYNTSALTESPLLVVVLC